MSDTSKVNISSINFSAKEKMVIQEFLTGAPYKIIAEKLNMSPSALEYHIRNIMNKTNCSSKTELMIFLNEQMELSKNKSEGIGNLKKIIFVSTITLLTTSVIIFRFFPRDNEQKTIAVAAEIHQFQEHSLERTEIVIKAMNILEKQKGIRTLAIVGEGGAGKTFLGRKILSQYNASIRWEINAETADSTYNSFFDLATRLAVTDEESSELERIKKIQSFDEKRKRLINFVSHFLHNADGWCLLFDNVDSVEYVRPYIPYNTELDAEVRHEPALALFANDNGLEYYKKILEKAPCHLNSNGYITFELGISEAESVKDIMSREFREIEILKDLAGIDRVIIGKLIK